MGDELAEQVRRETARYRARRRRLEEAIREAVKAQQEAERIREELHSEEDTPAKRAAQAVRLPANLLSQFTNQISLMMASGIHVVRALETLAGSPDVRVSRVADRLVYEITSGGTLSDGMSTSSPLFDRIYVGLVRTGEHGGSLVEVLQDLSHSLDRGERLRIRVRQAFLYPFFVLTVSLLMSAFLLFFMFPRFLPAFAETGAEMPELTLFIMALSRHPGLTVGLPLLLVALVAVVAYRRPDLVLRFRERYEIPLIGKLERELAMAGFCRHLGLLIKRGIPLASALKVLIGTSSYPGLDRSIRGVIQELGNGLTLGDALRTESLFPPMVISMISVGEHSGYMGPFLRRSSMILEDHVEMTVTGMVSMVEPIVLVVMGGLVGTIVLSVFLPLYTLTNVAI